MGQAYERLALPVSSDGTALRFETIDLATILGGGRGLHERVHEALPHHVFDRLTAARLAAVARLADDGFAWCEKLATDFFAYFELTKLWSLDPLRTAIADGVANGLFAYTVGLSGETGALEVADHALIRVRAPLRADEVDLGPGAALLSIAVAMQLTGTHDVESLRPGAISIEETRSTPYEAASGKPAFATNGEAVTQPATSASPRGRVRLDIRATEDDLHTLQRALTGLRDIVKPGSMHIELAVTADNPIGSIDPIQFQNRVRQHLEEDEHVDFVEKWE